MCADECHVADHTDADLRAEIADLVTYHKPDDAAIEAISRIRIATANLIFTIVKNCPANFDRSVAIRKAREAMMTANAAIVVPPFGL